MIREIWTQSTAYYPMCAAAGMPNCGRGTQEGREAISLPLLGACKEVV